MSSKKVNPEVLVALHKMLGEMIKDIELPPCEVDIDEEMNIKLITSLRKMADEHCKGTIAMAWKAVVAMFLQKSGALRPTISKMLKECMLQSATSGPDFKTLIEAETDELDKWLEEIDKIINTNGLKTRAGKTFVKGTLEIESVNKSSRKKAV